MLARIELGYSWDLSKMGSEEYDELRSFFPDIKWPGEKPDKFSASWTEREHHVDLAVEGEFLVSHGLSFEIKRFLGCRKITKTDNHRTVNIQVAIPNLLLFSVDEVQVLDDCCTDELQKNLEDGWRILAVCPPANQRRPDYVMGRQRRYDS